MTNQAAIHVGQGETRVHSLRRNEQLFARVLIYASSMNTRTYSRGRLPKTVRGAEISVGANGTSHRAWRKNQAYSSERRAVDGNERRRVAYATGASVNSAQPASSRYLFAFNLRLLRASLPLDTPIHRDDRAPRNAAARDRHEGVPFHPSKVHRLPPRRSRCFDASILYICT